MSELPLYIIVAAKAYGTVQSHQALADKVNAEMKKGYELLGQPFFGEEFMYQAMRLANPASN